MRRVEDWQRNQDETARPQRYQNLTSPEQSNCTEEELAAEVLDKDTSLFPDTPIVRKPFEDSMRCVEETLHRLENWQRREAETSKFQQDHRQNLSHSEQSKYTEEELAEKEVYKDTSLLPNTPGTQKLYKESMRCVENRERREAARVRLQQHQHLESLTHSEQPKRITQEELTPLLHPPTNEPERTPSSPVSTTTTTTTTTTDDKNPNDTPSPKSKPTTASLLLALQANLKSASLHLKQKHTQSWVPLLARDKARHESRLAHTEYRVLTS